MWLKIVLCLLVGAALAAKNPGWKSETEYVYEVKGRTLTGLYDISDQYSGMLFKAKLQIKPTAKCEVYAQISDAQYAQLHMNLPRGWQMEIPDSELNYESMKLSGKPFMIDMCDGVIRDIKVEQDTSNWEANIIRSVVSQFQLDTEAKNVIESQWNVLPENSRNNAVYKTLEDTVTGQTETLYEIHPIPDYILESKPWLAPKHELKTAEGDVIEVVKHKNYTSCVECPLYHYGLSGVGLWEPSANQIGDFFIRSSVSRAVLTGTLKRYTVQNSYTINKIMISPTLKGDQKGGIVSLVNVTLEEVRSQSGASPDISNPVSLGNLVYRYNEPFSSNKARAKDQHLSESSEDQSSSSEESDYKMRLRRIPRSLGSRIYKQQKTSAQYPNRYAQYQPEPQMSSVPQFPLLPYMVGYHGGSIKNDRSTDVRENVQRLAKQIAEELQDPEAILKQSTLSKFVLMNTFTRLLDEQELQEAAKELYSHKTEGEERLRWIIFRDSVAESGTGPAFLAIRDWLKSKKIEDTEAAAVVATMASAVRTPTDEYMRQFFELLKTPEIMSQYPLNETVLLTYSSLLRKVYVDKNQSHNQFPVHSFGTFNTKEGKTFMKETVIPHLTKKLHESVSQADTSKIHVYIRALGNIGHNKILEAFQPYLEGTKQASQFQRLMMVVALDKLAESHPREARSVLYKIYQNPGETKEIRVAAVYQLMRTSPPTDILQRMAEYTKMDIHEHVNAAVKSTIESASKLQSEEHRYFRLSAEAAVPLLTSKTYGVAHGMNFLKDYVTEEMKFSFKCNKQEIGSDDSYLPKGIKFALRENLGGLRKQIYNIQAMVSSVDELIDVWAQHTGSDESNKGDQGESKYSSPKLAKLMKLFREEREQLEGNLFMDMDPAQMIMAFDNHSIHMLPEDVKDLESKLQNGRDIQLTKLFMAMEIALSMPVEMGLPFLFTYDMPFLVNIQGKLQASATPLISRDGRLQMPDSISSKIDLSVTLSAKSQSRISFVTPFDHIQYISGYDRNMQVHVPVHGNVEIDLKENQLKAEFEAQEKHPDARLLHFSSWPYTSRKDIMSLGAVSASPETRVIRHQKQHVFDQVVGKKSSGLAFHVFGEHEEPVLDLFWIGHMLEPYHVWMKPSIQQSEISVRFIPAESGSKKLALNLGYQSKYVPERQNYNQETLLLERYSKYASKPQLERQKLMMNEAGAGIHSTNMWSYDGSVEFQGDKNLKYLVSLAGGKSNVDPNSCTIFYFRNETSQHPSQMVVRIYGHIPNTNGLALPYSLEKEPSAKFNVQALYEYEGESPKITAKIDMRRSKERKQYILDLPLYDVCYQQMQEGNYQLPACANLTIRANLLDRVNFTIAYENLNNEHQKSVENLFHAVRTFLYPALYIKQSSSGEQNKISGQISFHPDLKAVNVSVKTEEEETEISNIHLSEWAKEVLVVHPVFHLPSRLAGKSFGIETYRPICVVDQKAASTYSNRTYPISLAANKWTLMLMYLPRRARPEQAPESPVSVEEQLEKQKENFAILVRKNSENAQQKDVLITLRTPETDGKTIEIQMQPASTAAFPKNQPSKKYDASNPAAKITKNGQEITLNDKESTEIVKGYVEAYPLPNGEVKVEVHGVFYAIYDGSRVKVTAVSGKLRGSIVGLCGVFNDDEAEDFTGPQDCVMKDARSFVESYKIEESGSAGVRSKQSCYQKPEPEYVRVVSDADVDSKSKLRSCTAHTARYVEQDGEICFTRKPVPVCKCPRQSTITKSVSVHCIQKSNMASVFKTQIDRGLNPNFSEKSETRTIQMELPQTCSH